MKKLPTIWQRLACFFEFHPANKRALIIGEAWYVGRARLHTNDGETWNGDSHWVEKCPRCGRWHLAQLPQRSLYRGDSPEAKRIHEEAEALGWRW